MLFIIYDEAFGVVGITLFNLFLVDIMVNNTLHLLRL
jgi:hypothetical protein